MKIPTTIRASLPLALLPLVFLPGVAGCFGRVEVAGGPPILDESEPNDSADLATWFGPLAPGTGLVIGGHVTEFGPDLFDGFAFSAVAPCSVRVVLRALSPGADLDVCVYDPLLDEFVACFDSPFDPEIGEISFFVPGQDFQLVVSSAMGSASYTLEVDALPLYAPAPAVTAPHATGKRTLERLAPYRRAARAVVAAGWIGAIDVSTGERVERRVLVDGQGPRLGPARTSFP